MLYIAYNQGENTFQYIFLRENLEMTPKQARDAIKIASKGIDIDSEKQSICVNDPFVFFKEIAEKFSYQYVFPKDHYEK